MKVLAISILLALPSAAFANPELCLDAKKSGNQSRWEFWVEYLLDSKYPLNERQQRQALECLQGFSAETYVYRADRLVPESQAAEALAAAAAQAEADRIAAAAQAEADRQEKIKAEELKRNLAALRVEADRRKAEQQLQVVERLYSGCEALFQRHPDETITNKLCFDVFMERGLPE